AVQVFQRPVLVSLEGQRRFGRRHRQYLEAEFGDHAQRTPATGQGAADVVAGNVFHHLAAEGEQLTAAVDEASAEHVVARAADAGARRTGQDRSAGPAHRAARAQARRLEGQTLALLGTRRFLLGYSRYL